MEQKNYALFCKKYSVVLEDFCDADWNTLSADFLSITGYVFTLSGDAICWKSKNKLLLLTLNGGWTNCFSFS